MNDWHASDHLMTRYADGSLPESDACRWRRTWSALAAAARCGSRGGARDGGGSGPGRGPRGGPGRGARGGARAGARAPRRGPAHRWPSAGSRACACCGPWGLPYAAPWLPAVLLVAVGAVALAHGAAFAHARPWLLALAPVVPVAGVALSYGPHADPKHEITAATPAARGCGWS
ncbi:hypothetical protein GCM10023238_01470 [Streptomyces heliomycini]